MADPIFPPSIAEIAQQGTNLLGQIGGTANRIQSLLTGETQAAPLPPPHALASAGTIGGIDKKYLIYGGIGVAALLVLLVVLKKKG